VLYYSKRKNVKAFLDPRVALEDEKRGGNVLHERKNIAVANAECS